MDEKAKRMAQEDHSNLDTAANRKSVGNEKGWHNSAFPDISINEITIEDTPPLARRAKKRKLVKEPIRMVETSSTPTSDELVVTTNVTKPKKKASERHTAKIATIAASNATARSLFGESYEIKRLNEKIQKLQEELQHQRDLVYCDKICCNNSHNYDA